MKGNNMATKKSSSVAFAPDQKELLDSVLKETREVEYVETGDIGFDLALTDGKGIPMGSSTLLWAKPGSGKTTVVADACRRLIKKYKSMGEPFKVLYLAVEDSLGLMHALGLKEYIDSKDFIYVARRLCWRNVETFYEAVLNDVGAYADVKLIVIDSVNNVLSDQNTKNSCADGDYGTRSRERSNFYSKYLPLCKEKGVSSFFISQVRKKQQAGLYEDPNKAAVSDVDLHNVDIIIKCSASTNSTDASKVEEETVFGKDKIASKCVFKMDSKATDCKNRYIKGHSVSLLFEKGVGVWNYYTLRKLLEGHKFMKTSGGWWTIDPELAETFNLPKTKLRTANVNEIIQEHAGELVNFLKEVGKYKVQVGSTEIPISEDEIVDEENLEEEEE